MHTHSQNPHSAHTNYIYFIFQKLFSLIDAHILCGKLFFSHKIQHISLISLLHHQSTPYIYKIFKYTIKSQKMHHKTCSFCLVLYHSSFKSNFKEKNRMKRKQKTDKSPKQKTVAISSRNEFKCLAINTRCF